MNWEAIVGEFSLLTFLFLTANPWLMLPGIFLLMTDPWKIHRIRALAVFLVGMGILLFFSTYPSSPYQGGGLFISYLMAAEYIWRGKGPWKDWVHLSALLLMANGGVLTQGFYFSILALAFVILSLLRLYDSLYPGRRLLTGFLFIHLSASLLLAPLIFIFTPRKGLIKLGMPVSAISGPSSNVDLNFSGRIYTSPEIVMEIRGEKIPRYWKTRVFYLYYRGKWRNILRGRAKTGKERLKINIRNRLKINLFLRFTPALPLPPGGWSVILRAPGYWSYGHFIEFSKPQEYYEVFPTPGTIMVLRPEGRDFVLLGREEPNLRKRASIYLPEDVAERIRALAQRLKGDSLESSLGKIKKYLQENYRYSLEIKKVGKDPLEGFLFITRKGHCELFATAAAALLYAMGYDVRLVTGFRITEMGEGWAIARMKDAHAWVEVWDGERWRTFDPSPYISEDNNFLLKGWLGKVQFLWEKHIVNFSYFNQIKILTWLRKNYLKILLFLLALLLLFVLLRARIQVPSPSRQEKRRERENLRKMPPYYRRMLKIIPLKKPSGQTPMEFAKVIGKEAERITWFYYRERFGKIPPDQGEMKIIKEELKSLENRFKRGKGKN